jgi:hypothetical protein
MPLFGAPAGYGMGQHDPPIVSEQDLWNFREHVRYGIELIMATKGRAAYSHLNGQHPLDSNEKLDRAIFLREVVRRYNGGLEFVYENGNWVMKGLTPKHKPLEPTAREYANKMLGTKVLYLTPPLDPYVVRESNIAQIAGTMTAVLR